MMSDEAIRILFFNTHAFFDKDSMIVGTAQMMKSKAFLY